tara:strand:+ start:2140 stop:2352 length:213 start_codon:yes stop_codon:yes gene_type:complete
MPTLDDSPILEALSAVELDGSNTGTATAIASQDLILIYDQSQQKIKTITVANLVTSISDGFTVSATTGTD